MNGTGSRMRPLIPDTPARSALTNAFVAQCDASLKGFDWEDPRDALAKVREEAEEVCSLLGNAAPDHRLQEELGDLLFAVVNVARLAGVDPRAALNRATAKFGERFAEVERLARIRGLPMPGTPLADLDRLWDEIKAGNKPGNKG